MIKSNFFSILLLLGLLSCKTTQIKQESEMASLDNSEEQWRNFKQKWNDEYLVWYRANITRVRDAFPYREVISDYGPWTKFEDRTNPNDYRSGADTARSKALEELKARIVNNPAQSNIFFGDHKEGYELQPDCVPYAIKTTATKMLGTVIAFHGYTACTQQFRDLAMRLVREGFNVVVPLLPGQGRAPIPMYKVTAGKDENFKFENLTIHTLKKDYEQEVKDFAKHYGEYLPAADNGRDRYIEYIKFMNSLMTKAPGPIRGTTGLSVGGTMAALAPLEGTLEKKFEELEKPIYNKSLILAPYFQTAGDYVVNHLETGKNSYWQRLLQPVINSFKKALSEAKYHTMKQVVNTLAKIKGASTYPISWGIECYYESSGLYLKQGDYGTIDSKNPPPVYISKTGYNIGGRNGICDFHLKNGASINAFGAYVTSKIKEEGHASTNHVEYQFIGISEDESADTGEMKWHAYEPIVIGEDRDHFIGDYEDKILLGSRAQLCFYKDYRHQNGENERMYHSFFSPQDNQGSTQEWNDFFLEQGVSFFAKTEYFFKTLDEADESERPYPGSGFKHRYAKCATHR